MMKSFRCPWYLSTMATFAWAHQGSDLSWNMMKPSFWMAKSSKVHLWRLSKISTWPNHELLVHNIQLEAWSSKNPTEQPASSKNLTRSNNDHLRGRCRMTGSPKSGFHEHLVLTTSRSKALVHDDPWPCPLHSCLHVVWTTKHGATKLMFDWANEPMTCRIQGPKNIKICHVCLMTCLMKTSQLGCPSVA